MKQMGFLFFGILFSSTVFSQSAATLVVDNDVLLHQIAPGFYVHESFTNTEQYGRYSSNGLLYIENGEALMIDTPDNPSKTEALYRYLADSMGIRVTLFIGGHFHDDCIGGLDYLKRQGVSSILNQRTREKCREWALPLPDTVFDRSMDLDFGKMPVQIRYFGGGHTADNIVVYFPSEHILFGGCLIKSLSSRGLGNLSDSVLEEWKPTVEKLMEAFPEVRIVVPGHGLRGDAALLHHTVGLVEQYKR